MGEAVSMKSARVGQWVTVDGFEVEGPAQVTLELSHGGVLLDRRVGTSAPGTIGFRYWNVSSLSPSSGADAKVRP